jgi:hypothetical protein
VLGLRVDTATEDGDLAVDSDPALIDEILASPPAAVTSTGQNLLKPLALLVSQLLL